MKLTILYKLKFMPQVISADMRVPEVASCSMTIVLVRRAILLITVFSHKYLHENCFASMIQGKMLS